MRKTTAQLIVLLAVLSLPLQTLASVLLPCLHAGDSAAMQTTSHPCHSMTAESGDKQSLTDDCHKCQLCQMLSGTALIPLLQVPAGSGSSVYSAKPLDHFYSFSPGQLRRPPSTHTPV